MPNMFKIAEAEVTTATTATLTFSSIPQTYTHLRIIGSGAYNGISNASNIRMYFNGDTTDANYFSREMYAEYGGTYPGVEVRDGTGSAKAIAGWAAFGNESTGDYTKPIGPLDVRIGDYTTTNFHKTAVAMGGHSWNVSPWRFYFWETAHIWKSTSAITSVSLDVGGSTNYFSLNTKFHLYGLTS